MDSTTYKIKSIKIAKKRATIVFEDDSSIALGFHSFTDQPLYEGKVLSAKEYAALRRLAGSESLYEYAIALCLKQSKTVHEVAEKLRKKGAEESEVKAILKKLKDAGMLDDAMFASVYATDIADLRLYGHNRVKFDLQSKGIGPAILAALPYDEEKERARARAYAELLNKRADKVPNKRKALKMVQGLIERGFDEEIARCAVEEMHTDNDPEAEFHELQRDYYAYKCKYERKYQGYDLRSHIIAALLRKGYSYEDIQQVGEEQTDAD